MVRSCWNISCLLGGAHFDESTLMTSRRRKTPDLIPERDVERTTFAFAQSHRRASPGLSWSRLPCAGFWFVDFVAPVSSADRRANVSQVDLCRLVSQPSPRPPFQDLSGQTQKYLWRYYQDDILTALSKCGLVISYTSVHLHIPGQPRNLSNIAQSPVRLCPGRKFRASRKGAHSIQLTNAQGWQSCGARVAAAILLTSSAAWWHRAEMVPQMRANFRREDRG